MAISVLRRVAYCRLAKYKTFMYPDWPDVFSLARWIIRIICGATLLYDN